MGWCRVNFKFNFTLQYFNDIYKIARSGDHTDNNIPPSLIKKTNGNFMFKSKSAHLF